MKRYRFNAFIQAVRDMRDAADDTLAVEAPDIYPAWKTDVAYVYGNRVIFGGTLYMCIQPHTSISAWEPGEAASLWAKVLIPDENQIPEWEQPDSTNPYKTGDKVTHNGTTWISTVDNNVWEPGVYGWDEYTE